MDEALRNALRELDKADINPFMRLGDMLLVDLREVSAIASRSNPKELNGRTEVELVVSGLLIRPNGSLPYTEVEEFTKRWQAIRLRSFR